MLNLGTFLATILKTYCHISNQHFRIYLTEKFCEKTKISYLSIFGQQF